MSSEASIYLRDRPIKSVIRDLRPDLEAVAVSLRSALDTDPDDEVFTLFLKADRLWELSRLFTQMGQDLAALAPTEGD